MIKHTVRIISIWLTVGGCALATGVLLIIFSNHGYGAGVDLLTGIDGREYIKVAALISAWPFFRFWQESRTRH
ncbi:MAG: hypothetical protein ACR2O4_01115 [Hyphomicrobiaceae bacterium]